MTIGVECESCIVPVGPPASREAGLDLSSSQSPPTEAQGDHSATSPHGSSKQKHMKLSLWDTAGQETYRSITRSYFRGASGALLVFDITRPDTFASVTQWLNDLRLIAESGVVVILVGNKSDLVVDDDDVDVGVDSSLVHHGHGETDGGQAQTQRKAAATKGKTPRSRCVSRQEIDAWCSMNNVFRYVKTSAKSGENVECAFHEVAERIYQNIERGKYDLNDRRSGVKGYSSTRNQGRARSSVALNRQSNASKGCC